MVGTINALFLEHDEFVKSRSIRDCFPRPVNVIGRDRNDHFFDFLRDHQDLTSNFLKTGVKKDWNKKFYFQYLFWVFA